jgi:hypothetical protein
LKRRLISRMKCHLPSIENRYPDNSIFWGRDVGILFLIVKHNNGAAYSRCRKLPNEEL